MHMHYTLSNIDMYKKISYEVQYVDLHKCTVLTYPEVFTLLGVRVAQSKTDRPQIQGLNTDYRRKPYEPHHRILKAKRTF